MTEWDNIHLDLVVEFLYWILCYSFCFDKTFSNNYLFKYYLSQMCPLINNKLNKFARKNLRRPVIADSFPHGGNHVKSFHSESYVLLPSVGKRQIIYLSFEVFYSFRKTWGLCVNHPPGVNLSQPTRVLVDTQHLAGKTGSSAERAELGETLITKG